jgi:hypothetical protein
MESIDLVKEAIEDVDLRTWLDIGRDAIENVYIEIENRGERVDRLIKSIAS